MLFLCGWVLSVNVLCMCSHVCVVGVGTFRCVVGWVCISVLGSHVVWAHDADGFLKVNAEVRGWALV